MARVARWLNDFRSAGGSNPSNARCNPLRLSAVVLAGVNSIFADAAAMFISLGMCRLRFADQSGAVFRQARRIMTIGCIQNRFIGPKAGAELLAQGDAAIPRDPVAPVTGRASWPLVERRLLTWT
jgi:hypothetical protein